MCLLLAVAAKAAETNLLPNGGFEICGHLSPRRVEAQAKAGLTFGTADPLLPLRWMWIPHGAVDMRLAPEAHSGAHALQVSSPKGGLEMEMQVIEVVPGATYAFGGWAKGKGNGRVVIYGNAYEGRKELAKGDLTFKPDWAEARQTVTIPGNVRTVSVGLGLWSCEQALVDDLFFSADVVQPFDVNAVMTTKYAKDEHTLLLVDFDGQGEYRLESKAVLTDDKGGRFGKGARLSEQDVSAVVVPLSLQAMPSEGTLEFWFSPDDEIKHRTTYMLVLSGARDVLHIDDFDMIRLRCRTSDADEPMNNLSWRDPMARQAWIYKGEWHHVAFEWDQEAVRLYVDGALASYSTERPLPFFGLPSAIWMGGNHVLNSWSGVVDEVRLSDIKRYGPIVPAGMKWKPLAVPEQTAAKDKKDVAPTPAKPAPDFARERKALIGTIPPPPAGTLSFDATQVKPLVQDDPDFRILENTPVPGMTVAKVGTPQVELFRTPDNDGGYWPLKGVPAGSYYVGIWYESSREGLEARQHMDGAMRVYLNGRALQLATHSEPVQVAPGVYYAEAQSKVAEPLKEGDEIEVLGAVNQPLRLARLTLHQKEPGRGHGWMFENYGANLFERDSALRLNVFCGYLMAPGKRVWNLSGGMDLETDLPDSLKRSADGKALAYYKVANPLPVPLTVKCTAEVKAYYRELVGGEETTLSLKPHERVMREVPFTIIPDSRRYSMEVKINAVAPPSPGWPAADTVDFFQGVRQSVPWPDLFNNEFRRSIAFGQPLPGVRQRISLNGPWERALTPLPTAPPVPAPADLKWELQSVPFQQWFGDRKPQPHAMYLRRKFTLPEGDGKRTWRLLLTRVIDEATAYVNGQKVGNVRGRETPLCCDITKALRPGENDMLLVVRDGLANMDPAYVNPNDPVVSPQHLDAPGVGYGFTFAVFGVRLLSSPLVTAEDLQVNTSVRKKVITARFNVTNRETDARKLNIKVSALDGGAPVLDVGETTAELAAGASKELNLAKPWEKPVFWGPGSPKLYTLAVEVVDAATGQRLDLLKERFGFRESWIQNGRIMLNGAPVRLKGSNCGGGEGTVGGDDVQWTRGSDGKEDFLDEYGVLTGFYTLGGLGNTPSRHNVERDIFWEIETKNVLAGAAQYVNHPCIIAWDLSNEWLSFLSYGGGDPLAGARRFKAVGDALLAYDPSRWILFDGDRDLNGLWDTLSEHYIMPYAVEFSMRGHSPYLPDSRFWRGLDKDFTPGAGIMASTYHKNVIYHPEKTVLMNTENAWKVDGLQPPGLSMVAGEDDILGPAVDSGRGAIVWYWKQIVDGHRDLGFSIVCNYTRVTGLAHRGHMLQCFIMPEHSHHYFSGQKLQRRYSLHNDLLVTSQYDFRWNFVDASGKSLAKGNDERTMDSGDMQRGQFSLGLPQVTERTRYTLRLELLADGKYAYGEERGIEVYPDVTPKLAALARKIALFDPSGKTAEVFKKAGIPFAVLDKLSAPEGKPLETVLVLGERALQGGVESAAGSLNALTEAGGRVVAMMQERLPPGLPIRTTLESREWCSMVFLRTPQHPILQGLDSWDLQFWAPDHVVAKGAYSRPDSGSFVSLVDGAGDHDRAGGSITDYIELMECYRGQGSYLLCQMPLAEKYDAEPMAREMLSRLMSYAAGASSFRTPTKTLKVVGAPAAAAVVKLRDIGVAVQQADADTQPDRNGVMMVDAATLPAGFTAPPAWKTALETGTTIWVHGAAPEQKPLLSSLAGRPVEMTVQPYAMWEGRGYRNGFTWLTPGLSHIDLYWKNKAGDEGAVAQAELPRYKIEDLNHWSVKADGAVEHVFPGALIEIPVGKGRLILDEIRWETANSKLTRPSLRVVSSLLAGLEVGMAPYVPQRSLPSDVFYKPLDISVFYNRGFKDDVGDDGKGGWADQGPKADLREFPTGSQHFGGVPFTVGKEPRCCIVLRSSRRPMPGLLPEEVTIPIGFPVEGLCFLHSATWLGNGEPAGTYQIQYDDGTSQEILLVDKENIRDWTAAPAEFARERITRSRVAWTGTTEMFPLVCVFQMLWVNPKPEAPVKAVRFANPAKTACTILISLTAAVRPGKADIEAMAAAQAKAKEWLKTGIASLDAGREADARQAFQEAVKADPKLDAAHQRLCELAERSKDEAVTLAAYKAWAAAGPRTPLPYNKIGEILERRQDDQGALEAYTKSLEVEWNQPPIIEAKARLMLRLKK